MIFYGLGLTRKERCCVLDCWVCQPTDPQINWIGFVYRSINNWVVTMSVSVCVCVKIFNFDFNFISTTAFEFYYCLDIKFKISIFIVWYYQVFPLQLIQTVSFKFYLLEANWHNYYTIYPCILDFMRANLLFLHTVPYALHTSNIYLPRNTDREVIV